MRWLLAVLAMLIGTPAFGFEGAILPKVGFSAVAVHESGSFESREILHYSDGRLRIDRGNGFATTILDLRTDSQCMLMANHTYLVLPLDDELFRRYFAQDPELTGAWKMGAERVDGIQTTKFAFGGAGALKAAGRYWVTGAGILLRRDYDDGVKGTNIHHVEFLRDLKIGPQPESLFVVPPGYHQAK